MDLATIYKSLSQPSLAHVSMTVNFMPFSPFTFAGSYFVFFSCFLEVRSSFCPSLRNPIPSFLPL